jgi:hypothetical protein
MSSSSQSGKYSFVCFNLRRGGGLGSCLRTEEVRRSTEGWVGMSSATPSSRLGDCNFEFELGLRLIRVRLCSCVSAPKMGRLRLEYYR